MLRIEGTFLPVDGATNSCLEEEEVSGRVVALPDILLETGPCSGFLPPKADDVGPLLV